MINTVCILICTSFDIELRCLHSLKEEVMNLILDLDGTLVDRDEDGAIARPHLNEFLAYVFEKFDKVSIWTNANADWFEQINKEVLAAALPPGKSFDFVWSRDQCVLEDVMTTSNPPFCFPVTRKPLSKVWKEFPETYNKKNTFIVDNTPETYDHNMENAVPVKSFTWDESVATDTGSNAGDEADSELLRLITYFEQTIFAEK